MVHAHYCYLLFARRQYNNLHEKLASADCGSLPQAELARLGKEYAILGGKFECIQEQERHITIINDLVSMLAEENKKY